MTLRLGIIVFAVLALLPPGSWSLCLGESGHRALEPTAVGCETVECGLPETDHASGSHADDVGLCGSPCGDSCEDYAILSGIAVRHASVAIHAPLAAPQNGFLPASFAREARLSTATGDASEPPSIRLSILRC